LYQDKVREHGLTPLTASNTHLSTLNTYTATANSNVSGLLSYKNSIQTYKEAIIEVSFDLDDQEDKVDDAQKILDDAKDELAKYTIYAPFSGTIASVSVEKGDAVSTATTLGSIITQSKIAKISLNEVDAANVKVGQKVTLTFDAIEDLSITGRVIEVDSVGTVSQGVVSYGVEISLDTQDDNVKPGMTVSATIITEVKQDVILVSSSAIKTSNGKSYVEAMETATSTIPSQQIVETGISDDTSTEIVSGLKEGDIIVTKTSTGTSSKTTTTKSSSGNLFDTGGPSGEIPGGAGLMMGK
jgi:HlyD family secretion protein